MDRFRYELRILGWRVGTPALAVLIGSALVAVGIATLTDFLTATIEMLLPLSAGIISAMLLTQDVCMELHLTLPAPFARTALRRFGLVLAWTALCAWLGASSLFTLNLWRVPAQIQAWPPLARYLGEQLVWIAPLLWLAAIGLGLALVLRNPTASAALIGGIWIVETFAASFFTAVWLHPVFLFPTTFAPFVDFWLTNRLELIVTGLFLVPLCRILLGNTEALLRSGSAENAS